MPLSCNRPSARPYLTTFGDVGDLSGVSLYHGRSCRRDPRPPPQPTMGGTLSVQEPQSIFTLHGPSESPTTARLDSPTNRTSALRNGFLGEADDGFLGEVADNPVPPRPRISESPTPSPSPPRDRVPEVMTTTSRSDISALTASSRSPPASGQGSHRPQNAWLRTPRLNTLMEKLREYGATPRRTRRVLMTRV